MYVCTYLYIYIYIYTHIHIYIYNVCIERERDTYIYIYIHIYIHTHITYMCTSRRPLPARRRPACSLRSRRRGSYIYLLYMLFYVIVINVMMF